MADIDNAISSLIRGISHWTEEKRDDAFNIMQDVALDGQAAMRERIDTALTSWGSARQAGIAHGPAGTPTPREHAGRRETDAMYNGINSVAGWVGGGRKVLEARWGWEEKNLLAYFLEQEHGNSRIAPMESIAISLFEAEDILKYKLSELGRK